MTFYHEEYCFVPWRPIPKWEGWTDEEGEAYDEPALPEGVYYEWLASLKRAEGLYFLRWPKDSPVPPGIKPVSASLKRLLISGRNYRPAIAIARGVINHEGADNWSDSETFEQFTQALRAELDNQRSRPFFLAKAAGDPRLLDGYKNAGCYYWIVGYHPDEPKREVHWVSDDFWVYQDPIAEFEVDHVWLCKRFGIPQAGQAEEEGAASGTPTNAGEADLS